WYTTPEPTVYGISTNTARTSAAPPAASGSSFTPRGAIMTRAIWNATVLAESDHTVVVEGKRSLKSTASQEPRRVGTSGAAFAQNAAARAGSSTMTRSLLRTSLSRTGPNAVVSGASP